MSKHKYKLYEETWFCVILYFIFFPLGLYLALRSRKTSKDVKNLMKAGVVLLILIYSYFAASVVRFKNNNKEKAVLSEATENLDVVNKEEFVKQGSGTVKELDKLLSKYRAEMPAEKAEEIKSDKENKQEKQESKDKGVSSANNMIKIKGDPYEYNVSYNTSTEGNIGKIDLLVTVKYPPEYVLDFNNSQFIKEVLGVMEGNNYDFDSFRSWVEKSENNYSGKNVINSSVYSRNVSDVDEVLNFNTGKEGIMQVNFSKKVEME